MEMGEIAIIIVLSCVVGFIFIGMIPVKKTETKHKKAKQAEGELYVKVGGKFYKVSEAEPEKKPQEKKYKPWVTW